MKTLSMIIFASAVVLLGGCSSVTETPIEGFDESLVEAAYVTPLSAKDENAGYLLRIHLRKDVGKADLPDGFSVLGGAGAGKNVIIYDDGRGLDTSGKDGIYTGVVSRSCLPSEDGAGKTALSISCKVEFAAPGQNCGNWGECSETSILGGETIFCVCLTECEFKFFKNGDSAGVEL